MIPRLSALVIFALASLAHAQVPAFEKGDRVTFIGDSITHGGSYHAAIYLFYTTRFPNQKFTAYNCGVSGDTAPGTNTRFATDIAPHKPTVATIMLGMNDAWAWCFAADHPLHSKLSGQKDSYETYTQAMDALATTLSAMDCRIVFIKPSIYDQTAELETVNNFGKNDQLARFGIFLDTLAKKNDSSVVDFHTPMVALNHSLQANNPSATIVGKDRVHPGAPGHFVMAYHFLKAQNMPSNVSAIRLDAGSGGKALQLIHCDIDGDIVVKEDSLGFTATERALPFPISDDQAPALAWIPFQHELNRQVLAVDNLAPGQYELTIDDSSVGQYSAAALKQGIDLGANTSTPQYQQALEVKALQQKQLAATSRLRTIAQVRHSMLSKIEPPVPAANPEALKEALNKHVEKSKDEPWYDYLVGQVEIFLESVPHEADYRMKEAKWQNKMWATNQPKAHHWLLKKVTE